MDYADPQTLFDALDNGDCTKVKRCLRAGQNLNQPDSMSRTLLMRAIDSYKIHRVHTLLAFHEHIDLNYQALGGATALMYAVIFNPHATHMLIQLGADVNITTRSGSNAYRSSHYQSQEDRRKVMIMLLLAGADPTHTERDDVIANYASKWLDGLEYAKQRFQSIFDNEMLEKTVCEFIFNEEFLRKVL